MNQAILKKEDLIHYEIFYLQPKNLINLKPERLKEIEWNFTLLLNHWMCVGLVGRN